MARAKRKGRKQAQRRQDTRRTKPIAASDKLPSTRPSNPETPSRKRALPSSVKLLIWLAAVIIAIGVPSYFLYKANNPAQANSSLGQSIAQQISSNFSFGFSQGDISKEITLQKDDAMSIRWDRVSNGDLEAHYQLGPYTLQNVATGVQLIVMVPATANLVRCGYADLSVATGGSGTQIVPIVNTKCTTFSSPTAKWVVTSVVPNEDQKGLFYLNLDFTWSHPIVANLGIGKSAVYLRYQGRFSTDPSAHFVPADRVKIHYDTSNSGNPTGLPRGVYLEYETSSSETVTSAAPPPSTTSENTQTWVADANRPAYDIAVLTQNNKTNEIFQLGEQGIFLIIGGIIGATFPRLRRRSSRDNKDPGAATKGRPAEG
jgi:hypothetical protein